MKQPTIAMSRTSALFRRLLPAASYTAAFAAIAHAVLVAIRDGAKKFESLDAALAKHGKAAWTRRRTLLSRE